MMLVCRRCDTTRLPGSLDYRCHACGGELRVLLDDRPRLTRDRPGMWRYADWLPVSEPGETYLGEGDTPVIALAAELRRRLGVASASMKCEHLNPTGSFKDRIAAVAVALARERGLPGLVGTSSGNGGAAAAAYGVRAGLDVTLFVLSDVVPAKLLQIRTLGARVVSVAGLGHDARATEEAAQAVVHHAAEAGLFPFVTGGRYSPEAMEGAKTIAHELAEQVPQTTAVYVPVGGGGLLSAIGRGYAEIGTDFGRTPRLVAVQPSGCATVRLALDGDLGGLSEACTTGVSGLQVAQLFDGPGAVEAIQTSGGHLTEVSDSEVGAAQELLARSSGLLVEPAGATALAGALRDAAEGRLGPDDRIVVLGTGAGYKDAAALAAIAGEEPVDTIGIDQIGQVLSGQR